MEHVVNACGKEVPKMIHGKSTVKRAAALCLTLALTVGILGGMGGADAAFSGAADRQPDTYESELESLKAQQKALDKKIEEAQAEIDKQKDDIEAQKAKYTAVKAKIDNVEDQLMKNEDAMVELDSRLREARAELEVKNEEIEQLRDEFMGRLKSMYLAGGTTSYENVLINSADFYDVLMRLELVKRVAEHDNDALDELMEKKRAIEAVQAEIEESAAKLKEQTSQYSAMRDELNAEKQELAKIIEDADGKLDTLALDKAALELRASQLEEQQKTTTTSRTTAEDGKAPESGSEEKKNVTEGAKTTTAVSEATAKTESGKKTTTTTEKPAETRKTATTTEQVTEPVTETTTERVTETEAPIVTEPPVTETEPVITTTEPYVEPEPEPTPVDDSRQAKIDIVMDYARSNVGGAYVWAGSSFRATDCSGLVMLSYAQIGINLPHLASLQAGYGTAVSYDELQEGDLVFFGSGYDIYHVAIYNGNGRIVHAANSNDGIIFSDLASFAQYNPIYCMRRII